MRIISAILTACLLCAQLTAYAADEKEEKGFGVDFTFDTNKKHYTRVDLNTQTLSVTPNYQWGDLNLSLDIPYVHQSAEGDVTVKIKCKRCRRGHIYRTLSINESDSGMGDISAGLDYKLWQSEDDSNYLNANYTHKFDNGEDGVAIGSGSIDDTAELAFSHYWDQLAGTLGAGHTNVNGGGSNDLQADSSFSYGYLDLSYLINDYLMLGVLYNYAESQYQNKPDHDEIIYSLSVMPTDAVVIKGYYLSDGEQGQPEYQAGLSATYSY